MSTRTAVITGAGSGLGRDTALLLAERGYQVLGTAITQAEVDDLAAASGSAVQLHVTDLREAASIAAFAADVTSRLAGRGLDLLINNAGVLTPGPVETVPIAAVRSEFEVNVFAALDVTNQLLPALRTARGRIVFISSFTAHFSVPFSAVSSASKAALEVFADIYRNELRQFGVEVVIAQPGNLATGGPVKSGAQIDRMRHAMTTEPASLYHESFEAFASAFMAMQNEGLSSRAAAAAVVEIAEAQPAPTRAPIGDDARVVLHRAATATDEELDADRRPFLEQVTQPV